MRASPVFSLGHLMQGAVSSVQDCVHATGTQAAPKVRGESGIPIRRATAPPQPCLDTLNKTVVELLDVINVRFSVFDFYKWA